MKKRAINIYKLLVLSQIIILLIFTGCKKTENPIKYPFGTFPDSVYNLSVLNSEYDDYNSNIPVIGSSVPIIYSSNRGSSGGQFDLIQGTLYFQFDQSTGNFNVGGETSSDPFYTALTTKANSSGNEFGPYSIFSSVDGYEYFMYATDKIDGQLDLYYLKFLPRYGNTIPDIKGPYPATLLNTLNDEGYISFDMNEDSAYFMSNRGGNYDIYLKKRGSALNMDTFLNQTASSATLADSVNSSYDDKCPFVYRNVMVFTSNRPGGLGGYDLYYSVFRNGNWSSPVNFGPRINSASDEYRPLIGYHPDFTNNMMVFSSNRAGGKGGFDLYFTGVKFTK